MLVAVAVLLFVAALRTRRRDLVRLSVVLGLGIPAQAVIGGITVLTELNSWIVSLHLLLSLGLVALSVRFLQVLDRPVPPARGPAVALAWGVLATAWVVFYLGTIVTGAGPHAGDAATERNGLDPAQWSQLHADAVFLLLGLTVGLVVTLLVQRAPRPAVQAALVLLGIELGQGVIGFVQYFTDLPVLLVGLHLLGAAVLSASVTWTLLRVRHP